MSYEKRGTWSTDYRYYAILSEVSDLNVKVTVRPIPPPNYTGAAPAKPTEMRKGVDQATVLN